MELRFHAGTIELRGADRATPPPSAECRWDSRSACYRAPASAYADVVRELVRRNEPYEDEARAYGDLDCSLRVRHEPRSYQSEALRAWLQARARGLVVLPTGAGKSYVAMTAIESKNRDALVVAPTLDLVRQWYDQLRIAFGRPVGVVGGGEHEVLPLTVTTYDSAWRHMEHLGGRFGLVVFDECHHLPGSTYAQAAEMCIAPFRLGLTATPERQDGRESELEGLIGPVVYEREIVELEGTYLADYRTERLWVELSPEERAEHDAARAAYIAFLRRSRIRMGAREGWSRFVMMSSRSEAGRTAMKAYRRQRELAFAASAKLDLVGRLLHRHRHDRAILFTGDNRTAYALSRRFLIPAITHQTKVKERSEILRGLSDGTYAAVVTSRVLNEGVDVPDANVAVVISGSGSVREHVQRLGRILRKKEGKHAVLYELITADTGEANTSRRRRDHSAYR